MITRISLTVLLLAFTTCSLVFAQDEAVLLEQLSEMTKSVPFNVGAILQSVYAYQNYSSSEDYNSFSVETSRLRLYGKIDKGFSYFMQYDFSKQSPLLDASISYTVKPFLGLKVGAFKSPFSREYLTIVSGIDFVNRSQVVNSLVPKRQIGMSLYGWISPKVLRYQVGVFNGNGVTKNANDNSKLMTVGRVSFYPSIFPLLDHFEIGVNAGYDDASKKSTSPNSFTQTALMGIDFRAQIANLLLAGELLNAKVSNASDSNENAVGYHLTFGYTLNQYIQLLGRMDSFTPYGSKKSKDLIILGVNYNPSTAAGFQLNYIIPRDRNDGQSVLINFQLVI